jgi:glycyl-tRNA synthetase beta chain
MKPADLLVEIGTEELPPKALRELMDAFAGNLGNEIAEARLEHGELRAYASPRRLAVIVEALAAGQENRRLSQKGPPVSVAYDDAGKPLPPATAFAKKCGVEVSELGRVETEKGAWLVAETVEKGRATAELLPDLIEQALADLPIPRRMRWGDGEAEFVRPVHWVVLLHGPDVIEGSVMGIPCGNTTMGHRFHSSGPITISDPSAYLQTLEDKGHVIADFDIRRKLVMDGVDHLAKKAGGHVVDGEALYDEVAALVEWPVPVLGSFDEAFLELPREVVVSTLTGHQRYFPIADDNGALLPCFVTVANLESKEPDKVRDGNERVIRQAQSALHAPRGAARRRLPARTGQSLRQERPHRRDRGVDRCKPGDGERGRGARGKPLQMRPAVRHGGGVSRSARHDGPLLRDLRRRAGYRRDGDRRTLPAAFRRRCITGDG